MTMARAVDAPKRSAVSATAPPEFPAGAPVHEEEALTAALVDQRAEGDPGRSRRRRVERVEFPGDAGPRRFPGPREEARAPAASQEDADVAGSPAEAGDERRAGAAEVRRGAEARVVTAPRRVLIGARDEHASVAQTHEEAGRSRRVRQIRLEGEAAGANAHVRGRVPHADEEVTDRAAAGRPIAGLHERHCAARAGQEERAPEIGAED